MASQSASYRKGFRLSMRMKLLLSLSAIAAALLVSSIISVMEFSRMSNYLSYLISGNINSINIARNLSDECNTYNLELLTVVGDDGLDVTVPSFDSDKFLSRCDSLKMSLSDGSASLVLVDSVMYSFSGYMLTSMELSKVLVDDFTDTRDWYFGRLQPKYNALHGYLDELANSIFHELERNSERFERGFYRSIIPGIVAVGVGLLLIILLLFFLLANYVNPVYRMLDHIDAYLTFGKKYKYDFDGDDQLNDLNNRIKELADENSQLKKRIKSVRESVYKPSEENSVEESR